MLNLLFHNQCGMLIDLDCLIDSEIELLNAISLKELYEIALEGREKAKENKIKQGELYVYKNKKIEFEYTVKFEKEDLIFKVVSFCVREEDLFFYTPKPRECCKGCFFEDDFMLRPQIEPCKSCTIGKTERE